MVRAVGEGGVGVEWSCERKGEKSMSGISSVFSSPGESCSGIEAMVRFPVFPLLLFVFYLLFFSHDVSSSFVTNAYGGLTCEMKGKCVSPSDQ